MPKHLILNVIDFGTKMDPVLVLLSAAVTGLQERRNDTAEVMFSFARTMEGGKGRSLANSLHGMRPIFNVSNVGHGV